MKLFFNRSALKSASVLICLVVLAGCASPPRGGAPVDSLDQAFQEPAAPVVDKPVPAPPSAKVRSALIPPVGSGSFSPADDEQRFDMAATDVDARDFFMSLVEGSPVNMIVHPKVEGKISVDLKNTTIEEVLQVIHNVYGYPYFKTGTVYQIMPAGLQARTFQVNYLNLIRKGSSQTRVNSGQVTQVVGDNNSDNTDTGTAAGQGVVSGSRIDTESTADFWTELTAAIQGLIGTEGGRKVIVQPQAGVVTAVAMADELRLVEEYLRTIQDNIQRQVVIEAKVLEVTLADGFQTGINWGALGVEGGESVLFGQTGGGSLLDTGSSETIGAGGSLEPGQLLPDGLATSAFGGAFSAAMKFSNFQAFVELLETQGDVQVLSSPRISTVNNQKAVIKVGSDEFFVTDISSDTNTGTTTTSSADITLTPFFSGIALDVTPQIDSAGRVILHIHPTVSEVVDQNKEINVFGVAQNIPVAYSTVRESDSVVYAENGQLVVIGGLMQETISRDDAGVPVLSKLPGVGALFTHKRAYSRKSELVILLRPRVIGHSAGWRNDLEATRARLERLTPELRKNWRPF